MLVVYSSFLNTNQSLQTTKSLTIGLDFECRNQIIDLNLQTDTQTNKQTDRQDRQTDRHRSGKVWTHNSVVSVWSDCLSELKMHHKREQRDKYSTSDN